jgi:hypothetical protein
MIRVNGVVRGAARRAGSAGLAGYRVLRLAWRGFDRPGRARVVTAAIRLSEARRSRSARRGGKRARNPDRAADDVERVDEADPQRVLPRQRGGRADQLADGVVGA